jgi:hypothetical protein
MICYLISFPKILSKILYLHNVLLDIKEKRIRVPFLFENWTMVVKKMYQCTLSYSAGVNKSIIIFHADFMTLYDCCTIFITCNYNINNSTGELLDCSINIHTAITQLYQIDVQAHFWCIRFCSQNILTCQS